MPIYEYKCKVCQQHFEVEQAFTDDTLATIEGCELDKSGQHQVKKVFAAPAIAFKGDGFYRNDSRTSSGNGSSASTDSSADSTAADSTSTESTSTSSKSSESKSSSVASSDKPSKSGESSTAPAKSNGSSD